MKDINSLYRDVCTLSPSAGHLCNYSYLIMTCRTTSIQSSSGSCIFFTYPIKFIPELLGIIIRQLIYTFTVSDNAGFQDVF